ncbi:hypothetical protein MKEN_00181300 [Mycena kentingensis (nom. inval.)]|nr:hypothetical protein MKEN_00181300 [Mycena kentingensis (nom. inval.)]
MTLPTPRERILLDHRLDITPIDQPLFPWTKTAKQTPTTYLPYYQRPLGRGVAQWQAELFGRDPQKAEYRTEPEIPPLRPDAPTLVAIFYPDNEPNPRRPLSVYLARIQRLANMGEQTMLYVPPELVSTVRLMRPHDPWWHIIDTYPTIWDIPTNTYQEDNFTHRQPALYESFTGYSSVRGWCPDGTRNHVHRCASYNAKAFITYDAVMRNPFGSDSWMYLDAGILDEYGPCSGDGELWGTMMRSALSPEKIARSIGVSGDTGVVFAEYMQNPAYGGATKTINHPSWTDPTLSWLCHTFIAHVYVGSSLGMLNYGVRFMRTVDDMDANDIYSAREEFVLPWVAIRYPNTIFSIPWLPVPDTLASQWKYPAKVAYTTIGGPDSLPPIVDPISTIYCPGYTPRRPNLAGSGLYAPNWRAETFKRALQWYYCSGMRWLTTGMCDLLGWDRLSEWLQAF